jgi:hypothetical protein
MLASFEVRVRYLGETVLNHTPATTTGEDHRLPAKRCL